MTRRLNALYRTAGVVAASAVVAGCAVGPDYRRPQTQLQATFINATQAAAAESGIDAEVRFWRRFRDPVLDGLIDRAVQYNREIAVAVAALREARAVAYGARAERFPQVNAAAGASTQQLSASQAPGLSRSDRTTESVDVGLEAFWELDLFGRRSREAEATQALVSAAEAGVEGAQISVVAELATTYFELRGAQRRLAVARAAIDNQSRATELVRVRAAVGRAFDLDLARAVALLEGTRAQIPALEAQIAAFAYAIGVLTGQQPAEVNWLTQQPQPLPGVPPVAGVGDPAGLIARRPDVRVAERQLAASVARIGVATADLFPTVSINGLIGLNASRFSGLSDSGATTYGLGASITWAALDFGRVRARIQQTEAGADAALARYERAVLVALQDLETALVRYDRTQRQVAALAASAEASQRASQLAFERFRAGVTDLTVVLEAERSFLSAQDALAQAEAAAASSYVAVYRALGGGWPAPQQLGAAAVVAAQR